MSCGSNKSLNLNTLKWVCVDAQEKEIKGLRKYSLSQFENWIQSSELSPVAWTIYFAPFDEVWHLTLKYYKCFFPYQLEIVYLVIPTRFIKNALKVIHLYNAKYLFPGNSFVSLWWRHKSIQFFLPFFFISFENLKPLPFITKELVLGDLRL